MSYTCRHNTTGPCVACNSEDTYYSGGKDPTVIRRTEVWIGNRIYTLDEGHADKIKTGATLRPAAVLLAEHIDTLDWDGLRVVELGAGLGLPGLVAAAGGADVTLLEADRELLVRAQDNALANGLQCSYMNGDWSNLQGNFDAIIGSEITYNLALIRAIWRFARERWTGKGPILFADPGRGDLWMLREAGYQGFRPTRVPLTGRHQDGRQFACDLWAVLPIAPDPG